MPLLNPHSLALGPLLPTFGLYLTLSFWAF